MSSQTIISEIDRSVNFVDEKNIGFTEARYVRREEDYFIVYLSSQTGCSKGCKFCHLTASGQTQYRNITVEEFTDQARSVLNYYNSVKNKQGAASNVHYNWMSRGEALANSNMLNESYRLLSELTELSINNALIPKFNVSTIMPKEMKRRSLSKVFPGITPTIYYSIYSMDKEFKRNWMPSALDTNLALDKLKQYQEDTKKIIKLHWAFIKDQNDDIETLEKICQAIEERDLKVEFNIVRYNSYSEDQGVEPSEQVIERNQNYLRSRLNTKIKKIPRVGMDVKASCGMFIEK